MQPPSRHAIIHGALVLFAVALVVRAGQVQLVQHRYWAQRAQQQHLAEASIPAPRGDIEDAAGTAVARSRELVTLSFALDLVPDRRALYRELLKLGVPAQRARPVLDAQRKWYDLRDRFQPTRVAEVMAIRGVRSKAARERVYVQSEGTRELLGHVDPEGKGVDGLELTLDSLLRGEPGRAQTLRNRRGQRFESPDMLTAPPRRGHTVRLTINQVLQDICDQAIADAARRLDASGGDIVVLDPHSGEIRCLTSHRRRARLGSASTLLEPFEPGSTLKPFLIGRLLEMGKARPDETIETFNGVYEAFGRRITDVHRAPRMTVADVIRHSSNVGIARLSERVSAGELFSLYRDVGFGTPSGVPFPSEASGVLYEPRRWSKQSHHSLAIGYELSVTPIQLAVAYGALANGGELMSPGLIKEIRDADGRLVYTHRPRVLRRVFEPATTRTLIDMLASVVDSGTGGEAELATFEVAGKSGTARRATGGRYGTAGNFTYTSTFVALFPARKPQYVVLIKLDNLRGTYYGGRTAAPVAKTVITAALAARDASLDWANLPMPRPTYRPAVATAPPLDVAEGGEGATSPSGENGNGEVHGGRDSAVAPPRIALVDSTPEPEFQPPARFDVGVPLQETPRVVQVVPVPDVAGLPLRVAVRELHRAGFRVQLTTGSGGTTPAAGTAAPTGSLVRLPRR